MNKEVVVSVIMPAYNADKYIGESIQSVIDQTYCEWELIIIDDGSTDATAKIIKDYQKIDTRITYIYQENQKQGIAKNKGISMSNGKYIAFLDADDLWVDKKLEISVNEIESGPYDLIFTSYYVFEDVLPKKFSELEIINVENKVYNGDEAIKEFLAYNRIPNLTVLAKKTIFLNTHGFKNRDVAEEYEMWLILLANGCFFKAITNPLSLYRIHSTSITAEDRHATYEIIAVIKDFGKSYNIYSNVAKEIVKQKIKYWFYHGRDRTNKRFRILIKGVFKVHLYILFSMLSYIFPMKHLRKIVRRLY